MDLLTRRSVDDPLDPERIWVSARDVVDERLDADHRLLFNPGGSGGVAVVNGAAHEIFRRFAEPLPVDQVLGGLAGEDRVDVNAVARRLWHLDLLEPVDEPASPCFVEARTLTAWLHLTDQCRLRCQYCYLDAQNQTRSPLGAMGEPVARASVEALVRSAVRHNLETVKLKYAGGEASLNWRVMLATHALARQLTADNGLELRATLLSGGMALPTSLIRRLREESIHVAISLDEVDCQANPQRPLRGGRPSAPLVIRTIERLLEQGHPPHLSITVTRRSAPNLPRVVRFALRNDLTFTLNLFRENSQTGDREDLRCRATESIPAILEAFAEIEADVPRRSVLGSVLDRGQLVNPRERPCGVGSDYVVIDGRGRISRCHMRMDDVVGEITRDDPLTAIRGVAPAELNPSVDRKEECQDCRWRYWCSGGCAVATHQVTNRYDLRSPHCDIYQAILPRALRLEGLRILRHGRLGGVAGGVADRPAHENVGLR